MDSRVACLGYTDRRVFSFGLFVADMIYRQKKGAVLPDEFLGIKRGYGDNAMISVTQEWIIRAKGALEKLGVSIDINFGGLSNAMVYVLAALASEGKIVLIAPCGNDRAGRANVIRLKKIGVDTRILRKLMQKAKVSAINLIRNLEAAGTGGDRITYYKDFAFYLAPAEGFPYSKWMPKDLKRQDIVHIGGIDLVLCPKDFPKKQKQLKYKKNISEMVKVARIARQKGATVVADFCMQDADFWEAVPDSFFRDVDVAKPGITQALAIYNSRHKGNIMELDFSEPCRTIKRDMPKLLKIQRFLLCLGFKAVFVTLDAGGTIISAQAGSVFGKIRPKHVPAVPVRKFVDGTGCGDAFAAGIIYCLRQGCDMFATACFASTIGSLIAERAGVSLEEQYCGRGKWLPAVTERLKERFGFSLYEACIKP